MSEDAEEAARQDSRELDGWCLRYRGWDAKQRPLREALTTLGNGHFATRGAHEEVKAGGCHYPGTYLAGGFDRAVSEVQGRQVENEDLVNWPNWLHLSFRCADAAWFDMDNVEVDAYELSLDLAAGCLRREISFRDPRGRHFTLLCRRFVSMASAHVAGIEWQLSSPDYSGKLQVRSSLDGNVENDGVARYRDLEGRHVEVLKTGQHDEHTVFLLARSLQSRLRVAQAARTRIFSSTGSSSAERQTKQGDHEVTQLLDIDYEAGSTLRVEKLVTLYSSRDVAISEPVYQACRLLGALGSFDQLLAEHEHAWQRLWRHADLELAAPDGQYEQTVLRLHIFHILQTASWHVLDRDVGMPARGLHGEAYRGHIFWDELFTLPYLALHLPEIARSLLLYRYRRLGEARQAATLAGLRGAMFPWQSGSDGREESQTVHLNPRSGRWIPDTTHRQRHVGAAIAFNVWHYYQLSNDQEFLSLYGAELLLEVARFWASLARYNPERQRYEIRGVVGPDEFHTGYPEHDPSQGLDNNAYTNVMASWTLQTARQALDSLGEARRRELRDSLDLRQGELDEWQRIASTMYVPIREDGVIEQFEGWSNLQELDWHGLTERHGDIQRLDRILEAEDDDPNRYQASKQADVLMLFYLFSRPRLESLLSHLGYHFDAECLRANVEYYLARTSHGSTLSRVVHAWVLARSDRERSWKLFREALGSDIEDVQGGTTSEGIHMGALGGTVDLMQRCYTGLEARDDVLWLNPHLPRELERLCFRVRFRGHRLRLDVTRAQLAITFERGPCAPVKVGVRGKVHEMAPGDCRSFDISR